MGAFLRKRRPEETVDVSLGLMKSGESRNTATGPQVVCAKGSTGDKLCKVCPSHSSAAPRSWEAGRPFLTATGREPLTWWPCDLLRKTVRKSFGHLPFRSCRTSSNWSYPGQGAAELLSRHRRPESRARRPEHAQRRGL